MFKTALKGLVRRLGYQVLKSNTLKVGMDRQRAIECRAEEYQSRNQELQQKISLLERQAEEYQSRNQELQQKISALERQAQELNTRVEQSVARSEEAARQLVRERDLKLSLSEQLNQLRATMQGQPTLLRPVDQLPAGTHPDRTEHDAAHWTQIGEAEQMKGNLNAAIAHYGRAMSLIHGYGPARARMLQMSQPVFEESQRLMLAGKVPEAKRALVRVVELDPLNQVARQKLAEIVEARPSYDLTKQCMVHIDPQRGKAMYTEAFLRVYEYLTASGLLGEALEFGVLTGFTARIQCEIMRDLLMWKEIHLFDSFEGLPEYVSAVDRNSYDIGVRNVWADRMRFPDDWIQHNLGCPVDVHIFNRLSEVVSPERICVYRGFFSETLKNLPKIKAAIVHIDCDLYQSTREVLTALDEKDVLQDGCVLMFDDYNCFKANPHFGERRALQEFLNAQQRFSSSPFFTYGFNGAAFFLHDLKIGSENEQC